MAGFHSDPFLTTSIHYLFRPSVREDYHSALQSVGGTTTNTASSSSDVHIWSHLFKVCEYGITYNKVRALFL